MATQPVGMFDRSEPRDAVFHRTRVVLADRRSVPGVVVDLSPHGLMARVEIDIAPGEWIRLTLPVVGDLDAGVRWALGGRLGCRIARGIEPADYVPLLAAIAVQPDRSSATPASRSNR